MAADDPQTGLQTPRRRFRLRRPPSPDQPRRVTGMADVGALLLAERLRRGLSQAEMAALLGLTRQKVQLLEAGQAGVAAETVLRVLADLGVIVLAIPSGDLSEARRLADRILSSPRDGS